MIMAASSLMEVMTERVAPPAPSPKLTVRDLEDYGLHLPVDSDAYNSVGGFVFGALGRLPKRGDTIQHNGYTIRVESVRENRIEAVRIRDHSHEGASDGASESSEDS